MADPIADQVKAYLEKATRDAEALQDRLEAGEDVPEEELNAIAKAVADALEEANSALRALVGPIDSALLREKMIENMTPEEFEEWSEDNAALQEYRAEKAKEQGA